MLARLFLAGLLMGSIASMAAAQTAPPTPAVPVEPVASIVDAFRSHSVVAVTAGHGEEWSYAFGLSLVRDPRFVAVVNDIVIEEGSARYQDVADRFVRGDEVSDEALSQIWRNTTQPGLGLDRPWKEFFTPCGRQMRRSLGITSCVSYSAIPLRDAQTTQTSMSTCAAWQSADRLCRPIS